jgi:ornithine carbamoyltransferase
MKMEAHMARHLRVIDDLSSEEAVGVLREAAAMKARLKSGQTETPLAGKTLAMIFEKPSTRTRVSFEVGMTQLGGHALCLRPDEIGVGTREDVRDVARVLSRYAELIMARTFAHQTVTDLAAYATVPVINGLSDHEHPCQALGDLLTMQERFGEVAGRRLAFVGDGNNVARSLAWLCAKLGAAFRLVCPAAHHLPADDLKRIRRALPAAQLDQTEDLSGVADADVIYTDVWASMGQEAEREQRKREFRPYQVNAALLKRAKSTAVVMHCLPAHRGEELTDEVIDGPQSIVYDQAENRLHAQKAVMTFLISR